MVHPTFKMISVMRKSALKVLAFLKLRKGENVKLNQFQSQFINRLESEFKKLSRTKYAKFIPSQYFVEETMRSSVLPYTLSELISIFDMIEGSINKITLDKHHDIMMELSRVIISENRKVVIAFDKETKCLEKTLKTRIAQKRDADLLDMFRVLNGLRKAIKINMKKDKELKNRSHKFSVPFYSYLARNRGIDYNQNAEKHEKDFVCSSAYYHNKEEIADTTFAKCTVPLDKPTMSVKENFKNKLSSVKKEKDQLNAAADLSKNCGATTHNSPILGSEKRESVKKLHFRYGETIDKLTHIDASRFSQANEKHCKAVAQLVDDRLWGKTSDNKYMVCMYIDHKDGANISLSKLKMDLVLTCLNTYFFPRRDTVKISWTDRIDQLMLNNTLNSDRCIQDIFGRVYDKSKCSFSTVMMVSRTAADLLRHKQLCLLDTLAVILGISRKSLLTVHMDVMPQIFI